jgi:hypothetical protein
MENKKQSNPSIFLLEYAKDLCIFVIKVEMFDIDNALHRPP